MKISFGIRLPVTGPLASAQNIVSMGVKADELGFDAITTHDHVYLDYRRRYHNSGGAAEMVDERARRGLPVTEVYETMTALSVLAGKTQRVRLIPCAAVLPWRQPVLFAKQVVTLHELSGGRFVCAVVIGNMVTDFEAMNVKHGQRGEIMDEYLKILHLILSGRRNISYEGKFMTLSSLDLQPKPSKKIPIWVGGSLSEHVLGRLASYGDGFIGGAGVETFKQDVPKLNEYLRLKGRDPNEFEIGCQTFLCLKRESVEARNRSLNTITSFYHGPEWDSPDPSSPGKTRRDVRVDSDLRSVLVGSPAEVVRKAEDYSNAGVTFLELRIIERTIDEVLTMMELFASEVLPSFS